MIEPLKIITNNPMCFENFKNKYEIEYYENSVLKIYEIARDYIHKGHKLLTHPLMSSVKPNETPYRTVCVSKKPLSKLDLQSLSIMEESIMTTKKFLKIGKQPIWNDKVLNDFQVIDYDVIYHALN